MNDASFPGKIGLRCDDDDDDGLPRGGEVAALGPPPRLVLRHAVTVPLDYLNPFLGCRDVAAESGGAGGTQSQEIPPPPGVRSSCGGCGRADRGAFSIRRLDDLRRLI